MIILFSSDPNRIRPETLLVNENEDAVFICRSSTSPSWLFSNGTLPVNSYQDKSSYKEEISFLYIRKVNRFSQGTYICTGSTEDDDRFKARSQLFVRGDYNAISITIL